MNYSLGFDLVDIERFALWQKKRDRQLLRIFSENEISYCRSIPCKSAERFAVRFAAREALYKALSSWKKKFSIPFLTLCKYVNISHIPREQPHISVQWQFLKRWYRIPLNPQIISSFTHTETTAGACILLLGKDNVKNVDKSNKDSTI